MPRFKGLNCGTVHGHSQIHHDFLELKLTLLHAINKHN